MKMMGVGLSAALSDEGRRAMSVPVVLDCDTGTDDAVAIMVAALHPGIELLGITTVWGNHDVVHTTDNSLRVLDLVGRGDVGVHPGRNGPVRPRLEELPPGRADLPTTLEIPAPTTAALGPAVEWLVETLRAATRPVMVVATGPLTNLAVVLAADPATVDALGRLVVLGGTHRSGASRPTPSATCGATPRRRTTCLDAGFRDVHLVTMDATFSAPLTGVDAARLRAVGTLAASTAADFVDTRIDWYAGTRRWQRSVPLRCPTRWRSPSCSTRRRRTPRQPP